MAAPDTTCRSEFMAVMRDRGYVHQASDWSGIDALAADASLHAYVGYDCTAPSLHVGSLVSIMMLHWLQATGAGRPVVLMGGGTTQVGDPSGKEETRRLLSTGDIESNKEGIKGVFSRFLAFGDGSLDAVMVDNADWLQGLDHIGFLRDVGRHFSVNRMLSMESVKRRVDRDQEMSFLEFNYMCLQAFDFTELSRRLGCRLQMGGSDQWGNMVMGVDLGRRMGTPQLHAMTCPLAVTSTGEKMGKTVSGAVWLDAGRLSPYGYWQFWRDCADADVARFLRLFTVVSIDEIERLGALRGVEANEAKKVLADEATSLLHGRDAAAAAAEAARAAFGGGAAFEGLPTVDVPMAELVGGLGVLAAFVRAGLFRSNGEVRRAVAARDGGLTVNGHDVVDERAVLGVRDLSDGVVRLSAGRKRHVMLRAT